MVFIYLTLIVKRLLLFSWNMFFFFAFLKLYKMWNTQAFCDFTAVVTVIITQDVVVGDATEMGKTLK